MAYIQQQQVQQDLCRGRKRRNEDEDMVDCSYINKAPLQQRRSSKCIKLSELKKQKTGVQKRSIRGALLETMDKDGLINIINSLLNKQPNIRQEIMQYIPAPTISSSMNVLVDLEKKFIQSFPFNKNGPGTDDYTFSRVREYLNDLIDTLLQYANHFTSSQVFPSTCFSFLDHATYIAHRLPNWDNDENNSLKKNLYQDLNNFWKLAIQNIASNLRQGEYYINSETVSEWAKSLAQHNSITNGYYFNESVHEFTSQLGYMIGLPETNQENTTSITPLKTTSIVGDRR
ncbi:Cut8 six-helix bundle-domain-containing protein [Thamnidium elegans]|nr:Cut8 six-helix bundle-domain-containing protein [Thamnidium elegans]